MAALLGRVEPALSRAKVPATEFLAMGTRLGEASANLAKPGPAPLSAPTLCFARTQRAGQSSQ